MSNETPAFNAVGQRISEYERGFDDGLRAGRQVPTTTPDVQAEVEALRMMAINAVQCACADGRCQKKFEAALTRLVTAKQEAEKKAKLAAGLVPQIARRWAEQMDYEDVDDCWPELLTEDEYEVWFDALTTKGETEVGSG